MTIEEAVRSAKATKSTVEAQEFHGYKYARLTTLTVKNLCKWVIQLAEMVEAGREVAPRTQEQRDLRASELGQIMASSANH